MNSDNHRAIPIVNPVITQVNTGSKLTLTRLVC